MPTYVYRCPTHGEFEVEQKITDPAIPRCTLNTDGESFQMHGGVWCGEPVERLISSGTSFVLKGPGWAKDGYK